MNNNNNTNVQVTKCQTLDEAQRLASSESANTSGTIIPGVLFSQGERHSFSAAMAMGLIMDKLEVKEAQRNNTVKEVASATNRPTNPGHVNTIAGYLKSNVMKKYIIPPMTLNVQQQMMVFSSSTTANISVGYAVIPSAARLQVTDGAHRQKAILAATNEMSDEEREAFMTHSVSVMITFENDLPQIHQDFADCSRSKALPPSLIASFDRRNPANGIVLDLAEKVPLFNDKIDATSTSLSKKSTHLFLVNHIRQFVKELVYGDWGVGNEVFEKAAKRILHERGAPEYDKSLNEFAAYATELTNVIKPWDDIAHLPRGIERNQIMDRRAEGWITMSASGLIILGRVGHVLLKNPPTTAEKKVIMDKLGKIDWRKDSPYWEDSLVVSGRILTNRSPIKTAMKKVLVDLDIGAEELADYHPDELAKKNSAPLVESSAA